MHRVDDDNLRAGLTGPELNPNSEIGRLQEVPLMQPLIDTTTEEVTLANVPQGVRTEGIAQTHGRSRLMRVAAGASMAVALTPAAYALTAAINRDKTQPIGIGTDEVAAKVVVKRTQNLTEYRISERFDNVGPLTLLANTSTRVVFERMKGESNAGEGGADFVAPPVAATDSTYTVGQSELEIGEGMWNPVRRRVTIGSFTCRNSQSTADYSLFPQEPNVAKTSFTVSSEYRSNAPIYEKKGPYLQPDIKKGFITKSEYKRLRNKKGDVTFKTVLGKGSITDTITTDPMRAVAFTDIPNQGVKRFKFNLKPGQKKSMTAEVSVDCDFDTAYAGDGRKGIWFNLLMKGSTRAAGARPKKVPGFIWKYIRLKGDSYPSIIYKKEAPLTNGVNQDPNPAG